MRPFQAQFAQALPSKALPSIAQLAKTLAAENNPRHLEAAQDCNPARAMVEAARDIDPARAMVVVFEAKAALLAQALAADNNPRHLEAAQDCNPA